MSKLSVQLVVWNGAKYLTYLFASLRNQIYKDWSLIIIDNNSTDNTVEIIKKELQNFSCPYKLIENKENKGFARGHAEAFKENNSEYVLLLNQDMYLTPDCLQKMVDFLDKHPKAGSVTPRLMRWDFVKIAEGLEKSFSNKIDALGLKIFRNRRVVDWATGREWTRDVILSETKNLLKSNVRGSFAGAQDDNVEVFGVSGAFPMYRRAALLDTLLPNGDFLDSSYMMYKEDVDLAYRLAARGWTSFVLLDSVAYHDRTGAGPQLLSDLAAAKNKQLHSNLVKYHSYKNHLMTLLENEFGQNFILDFPWILWYEFKKLVYFLLFDRSILSGLKEVWKQRKELINKRGYLRQRRMVSYKDMRKWWK